jgi:predicted O-methyltransferase YrrM
VGSVKEPFSTRAKVAINTFLKPLGFELITRRKERAETARLKKLQARGHWQKPRYSEGLEFRPEEYRQFLRQVCYPFQHSFLDLPGRADESREDGFFLDNGWFGPVDAEVLYCMIRHFQPRQIIEIGSGFSTRLMQRAIKDSGLKTNLTCIDPQPRVEMLRQADEHIRKPVEDLDAKVITDVLEANDILFIDSSHTITAGGDMPFLFLEVLPHLKRGVLIHIHDIFLPYDYPEEWVVKFRWGWTEQYLVHAFLCYNTAFEVVWPARYMWENHKAEVLELFPTGKTGVSPSSLWLKKTK